MSNPTVQPDGGQTASLLANSGNYSGEGFFTVEDLETIRDLINQPNTAEALLFIKRLLSCKPWQPRMKPSEAANLILRDLPSRWLVYALDAKRGAYRGFAALHDRCDANMLIPDAEWAGRTVGEMDEFTNWANLVMDAFNEIVGVK